MRIRHFSLKGKGKMKKIFTVMIIGILCLSMFSVFAPKAKAANIAADPLGWMNWGSDFNNSFSYASSSQWSGSSSSPYTSIWDQPTSASTSLTGDLLGNGQLEVVVASSPYLYVYSSSGGLMWSVNSASDSSLSGAFLNSISIGFVNGAAVVLAAVGTGADYTNGPSAILVYSARGTLIRTISGPIAGGFEQVRLAALNGDGEYEVIATVESSYTLSPRGVYVYSYSTGSLLWSYLMGPDPHLDALSDLTHSGKLDIVISTFAPCNGGSAGTTNDWSVYVIALTPNGQVLWIDQFGSGSQQRIRTAVADLYGNGNEEVIAFLRSDVVVDPNGPNNVYVLSGLSGSILAQYTGPAGDEWHGFSLASTPAGQVTIFADAMSGEVYAFDGSLNLLAKTNVGGTPVPRAEWATLATANLVSGQGTNVAILVQLSNGTEQVNVLDSSLIPMWSANLPGTTSNNYYSMIFVSNLGGNGINEILVAGSPGVLVLGPTGGAPAPDFQLNVSPQTLTVPCGGSASFSIQITSINNFGTNSQVQLSCSSPPENTVTPHFGSSQVTPSQGTYLFVSTSQLAPTVIESILITATAIVSLDGTTKNLVHTQMVTVYVTKLVGVKNVVSFDSINVLPNAYSLLWTGGWTGTQPDQYGFIPTSQSFGIQQDFFVEVPSGPSSTPSGYWVQNVIFFENFLIYGWAAVGISNVWNYTGGSNQGFLGLPIHQSYPILMDNPLLGSSASIPGTYTLTSTISGNQVVLTNDFFTDTWTIPSGNGRLLQNAFIKIDTGYAAGSPELVIVGPPNGATDQFLSSTRGSIQSSIQLYGQSWINFVDQSPIGSKLAATAEKSIGLNWQVSNPSSASFSDQSSSNNQQGIFFVPLTTPQLQNGETFEDQTSLTSITVSITGSTAPDGTLVYITTSSVAGAPSGIIQTGTSPAMYYDVNIQGISDGTATISITNSNVLAQTTMQYWNGVQWVTASDVTVSGLTISGNIPVSALTGTFIALGPVFAPPPTANFTYSPTMPGTWQEITFDSTGSSANFGNIVQYTWNFGDGNTNSTSSPTITHFYALKGTYNVTLTVLNSAGLINSTWHLVTVNYLNHDVTVASVKVSIHDVYQGWTVPINVTAANVGNATETFNVTLYYNSSLILIGTQTVINLAPNSTIVLKYLWNTADVPVCNTNYTITAEASVVPGETNTLNNVLSEGTVRIRIVGDVNGDGKVDLRDLISVAECLGSVNGQAGGIPVHYSGKPTYNLYADFNQDGKINILDMIILATHLGQHW